jgi:hypothetical protein
MTTFYVVYFLVMIFWFYARPLWKMWDKGLRLKNFEEYENDPDCTLMIVNRKIIIFMVVIPLIIYLITS